MHQEKESNLEDTEWLFGKLFDKSFLQRGIVPLLLAYLSYHLYLYFTISGELSTAIEITRLALGVFAYILLAFWLLGINYSFRTTKFISNTYRSKRLFPFPDWRERPYFYFLLGNGLLCLVSLLVWPSVLIMLHLGALLLLLLYRFFA